MDETEFEPDEVTPAVAEQDPSPNLPDADSGEYRTLAHGHLSPRHRRFAFLAAQGRSNQEIAKELGYADSRVSILLKNPFIAAEIATLQERIYEETIGTRMKSFVEPALNVIQMILNDKTNKVKVSEKLDVAKWVIEKIDGKATQKIEAGENMLAVLMDRLDAAKTRAPVSVNITNNYGTTDQALDVTPAGEAPRIEAPKSEEDELSDWVVEFVEPK